MGDKMLAIAKAKKEDEARLTSELDRALTVGFDGNSAGADGSTSEVYGTSSGQPSVQEYRDWQARLQKGGAAGHATPNEMTPQSRQGTQKHASKNWGGYSVEEIMEMANWERSRVTSSIGQDVLDSFFNTANSRLEDLSRARASGYMHGDSLEEYTRQAVELAFDTASYFSRLTCLETSAHVVELYANGTRISESIMQRAENIINPPLDYSTRPDVLTPGSDPEAAYQTPWTTYEVSITHYCKCSRCSGRWFATQDPETGEWSGSQTYGRVWPQEGVTIAHSDWAIGTRVEINGHIYTVQDRGSALAGGLTIDIYIHDHERLAELGRYPATVIILPPLSESDD
jgi:hypothetical protein